MSNAPIRIDDENMVTEVKLHELCTEASTLGLPPGAPAPATIPTTLGNGQPFIRQRVVPHAFFYHQDLGALSLVVLND